MNMRYVTDQAAYSRFLAQLIEKPESQEVAFGMPFAPLDLAKQSRLCTHHEYISVAAYLGGVVAALLFIPEFVASRRVEELRVDRRAYSLTYLMLPEGRCIDEVEGAAFELGVDVVLSALLKGGSARDHIERTCRGEVLCRLKNLALLSVVHRYQLHVIQREPPQIDCAVLSVGDRHAVVEDADVLASHAADIDRLEPPDAAVVLDLYAREITQGIGYGMGIEPLQLLAGQHLCRYDLFGGTTKDDDLFDVDRVADAVGMHLTPPALTVS